MKRLQPAEPAVPSRDRFNASVNGLRGLCTLFVFVYHVCNSKILPWPEGTPLADLFTYAFSSLRYGVELFFMISGFVIIGSLLRHASIGAFFRDRFLRIYSVWLPVHVGLCCVGTMLHWRMFESVDGAEWTRLFIANLLLLPPLVPLPETHPASWSLTYEWVFYLCSALVLTVARRSARPWLGGLIALLVAATVATLLPRALFFLTGILVYANFDGFVRQRRYLAAPWASFLVFLLAWRATGADQAAPGETLLDWIQEGKGPVIIVALLASIHTFAAICVGGSRSFQFLQSKPLQWLGNISYSFYLLHPLVMFGCKKILLATMLTKAGAPLTLVAFAASAMLISLVVSHASWLLLESTLRKRVSRWLTDTATFRGGLPTISPCTEPALAIDYRKPSQE